MLNEKALFLGPYGENKEDFQRLVKLLIEDTVGWRNNFHPNDDRAILPSEKREEAFKETQDKLYSALNKLLAEMKQSVPVHSPRYLGHMLSDVLTPALLGYFTGLIYNQNNVVGEVSTVTTRKEMEFSKALCKMVGYKEYDKYKNGSWAHLTSGGSTAILEAMWIARNMKYYPLSVKLLINAVESEESEFTNLEKKRIQLVKKIKVRQPNKTELEFEKLSSFELFNLSNEAIANFKDDIIDAISKQLTNEELDEYSDLLSNEDVIKLKINEASRFFSESISDYLVQYLGVAGVHFAIDKIDNKGIKETKDLKHLNLPKLYISQTSHYSWEKNLDILGIGKGNIERIKCDINFKIDLEDLNKKLSKNSNAAILMVTGIAGTTEESAIDPIHKMLTVKQNLEKDENKSFFFKIDGAWGGYYLSMLAGNYDNEEIQHYFENNKRYFEGIEEDLKAIKHSDSIVIDPHKMGYIPYAVGAICYKDTRYKEFIYKEAPYLATSDKDDFLERSYLGGWTVEGSRSGAAALACSLSADVLPLNRLGYGKISLQTIKRAFELYVYFITNNKISDIKIIPVYQPQGNVVCFLVSAPNYIKKSKYLNSLNDKIYDEMSVMPDKNLPNYLTSKTSLNYEKYENVMDSLFAKAEIKEKPEKKFELTFLRTVTMNPMLENYQVQKREGNELKKTPLFEGFVNEIEAIGQKALSLILMEIINNKKRDRKRLKLYWIENKSSFKSLQELLKADLIKGLPIGKYLDITFENYQGTEPLQRVKNTLCNQKFDFSIIDLNLIDSDHKEWNSGQDVISVLYGEDSQGNAGIPIVFTQFFDDKTQAESLKNMFKSQYPSVFKDDEQFLAKNNKPKNEHKSEELAIQELVKRLFILSQIE